MDKNIAKKAATLRRITERNIERVRTKDNAPFAASIAKYYPALKRLAVK